MLIGRVARSNSFKLRQKSPVTIYKWLTELSECLGGFTFESFHRELSRIDPFPTTALFPTPEPPENSDCYEGDKFRRYAFQKPLPRPTVSKASIIRNNIGSENHLY